MKKNFIKILTTILLLFTCILSVDAITTTSRPLVQIWCQDSNHNNQYAGYAVTSYGRKTTEYEPTNYENYFEEKSDASKFAENPKSKISACKNDDTECVPTNPIQTTVWCKTKDKFSDDNCVTSKDKNHTFEHKVYRVNVTATTTITKVGAESNHGRRIIPTYQYKVSAYSNCGSSDSDYAYCIQPSKSGPSTTCNNSRDFYSVASTFNVKECKNVYDKKIGYSCGLAQILYYAKDADKKDGGLELNEDNSEAYNAISTALRMWVTYWFNKVSPRSLTRIDGYVTGKEYSNSPIYYNTAQAVLKGYEGENCDSMTKKYADIGSVLCYTNNTNKKRVTDGIKLFKQTLNSKGFMGGKWEGVENVDIDISPDIAVDAPVSSDDYKIVNVTATVTLRDIKEVEEKLKDNNDINAEDLFNEIKVACDPTAEGYSGECSSYVLVRDVDGNMVQYDGKKTTVGPKYSVSNFTKKKSADNDGNGKHTGEKTLYDYSFKVNIYYYKVCKYGSGQWSELEEGNASIEIASPKIVGYAKIIQYVHATNAGVFQVMMSYSENIWEEVLSTSKVTPGTLKTYKFDFDCNPEKCTKPGCSDLSQKTDADIKVQGSNNYSSTCKTDDQSALGYQYSTFEDADMGCIVNSCNDKVEDYDITGKVGANSAFCQVYNRKDIRFYISNPAKVYAGMQFSYDLGKKLKSTGIITKQNDADNGAKLTSVVLEKEQFTSVFDSDKFEEIYSDTSGKRRKELLYQKYNCLLYTDEKIAEKMGETVSSLKSDGIINSQNENIRAYLTGDNYPERCNKNNIRKCINLEVSYDEKGYDSSTKTEKNYELSIARTSESTLDKNIYRCTGSNCFTSEYEEACVKAAQKGYKLGSGKGNLEYASIFVTTQNDYYLATQFYSEQFTGNIQTKSSENNNALPKYTYPISSETTTKLSTDDNPYNFKYNYTNVSTNSSGSLIKFNYTCPYTVYNVTKKNSCNYKDKNGNTSLNLCSNSLYTIENGVVNINDNGIKWNKYIDKNGKPDLNKYSSGIIFRNITLSNVFPRYKDSTTGRYYNDDGVLQYSVKNNWVLTNQVYNPDDSPEKNHESLYVEDVLENIENSGDKLYTNSDKLNYSYTLTSDSIKAIKEYNSENHNYLNSSLYKCKAVSTGLNAGKNDGSIAYYKCQSKFLDSISKYGVIVNKDWDNEDGGDK